MTLNPQTTFFDGNDQGTPGTAASGTYGPIRMSAILNAINNTSVLQSITATAPPGGAAAGNAYYVAAPGTGAWAGQDGQIAYLTDTGWAFFAPVVGKAYGDAGTGGIYTYDGTTMAALGGGGGGGQTDTFTSANGTILNAGNNVGLNLDVDAQAVVNGITLATAAEVAALDGDEQAVVRIDDGTLRRVNLDDLPGGGASGFQLSDLAVGEFNILHDATLFVPAGQSWLCFTFEGETASPYADARIVVGPDGYNPDGNDTYKWRFGFRIA
ncbi:DUF2793 domain-containing protein [uncultured Pelagimonas sp.]|uniref:DUF2793 domain-containing protein n=1 Tax=uncultured Pelagimonas sp. TaxID=1618102 RepID=UPI0026383E74|nr:DUF2793 domain-containing protein [uncultured Pelagimonas sp.]